MALFTTPLAAVLLFAVLLLLIELGHALRSRHTDQPVSAAMESAIFALFGLLLAFTFSGAMSRYDAHRSLFVQEANDIGTAYLRLDLLPAEAQPALRQQFRTYAEIRAHRFDTVDTPESAHAAAETTRLQNAIWTHAVAAAAAPGVNPDAGKLLLTALNDMIDITATRKNAFDMHPPTVVYALLLALAGACSLLAGYGSVGKGRNWVQRIGFAAAIAFTLYATIDIEYPRRGLITLASHDEVFADLIQSMQ